MFYLLFILIIATILRLYNLTAISLWHDEAFSALLIKYNLKEMMQRIALDVHPPFYYLVLKSWNFLFENSLFSLRMFSVLFGILTVFGVYLFVKEIFKNNQLALFSSLLVAVNPFQIQYALEARMYTLGSFLVIFSSYFLLKAISSCHYHRNRNLWWVLYIFFASAAIYTHYYILFSIFAQAVFIFFYCIWQTASKFNLNFDKRAKVKKSQISIFPPSAPVSAAGRDPLKADKSQTNFSNQNLKPKTVLNFKDLYFRSIWDLISRVLNFMKFSKRFIKILTKNKTFHYSALAYSLIALSYLPWLKIFLKQINQVRESYWIPSMNFWSIANTFWKMTTGLSINSSKFRYILIILIIIISLVIISVLKKKKQSAKWLIFFSLIIPFIGAGIFSLKTSVYLDRYFIFVSAFYLIFIALGIFLIKNRAIKATFAIALILGNLGFFVFNWNSLDVDNRPGIAGVADYLNQETIPGDKIFIGSSFIYFTFKYYNKTLIHPRLYAPEKLPHFSGTALLSKKDIIKNFSQEVKKGEIIWFLNTTGFGNFQPELPSNWIKLEEKKFQDIYDYRGWIIVSKYKNT